MELDDLDERIDRLAMEGYVLLDDENNPQGAIAKWQEGLDLLPDPKTQNPEALWLFASIGEAYLEIEDDQAAMDAFQNAYASPDGHINPLVLLRLGEGFLTKGEEEAAVKFLLRAYMIEGEDVFEGSEEALAFLKNKQEL